MWKLIFNEFKNQSQNSNSIPLKWEMVNEKFVSMKIDGFSLMPVNSFWNIENKMFNFFINDDHNEQQHKVKTQF